MGGVLAVFGPRPVVADEPPARADGAKATTGLHSMWKSDTGVFGFVTPPGSDERSHVAPTHKHHTGSLLCTRRRMTTSLIAR